MQFEAHHRAPPADTSSLEAEQYMRIQEAYKRTFVGDPRIDGLTPGGLAALNDQLYRYLQDTSDGEDVRGAVAVGAFYDWAAGKPIESIAATKYNGNTAKTERVLGRIIATVRKGCGKDSYWDAVGSLPPESFTPQVPKPETVEQQGSSGNDESKDAIGTDTTDTPAALPTQRRSRQPKSLPVPMVTFAEVEELKRKTDARVKQLVKPTWRDAALCSQLDADRSNELFFPTRQRADVYRQTGKICAKCGVRAQCSNEAVATDDTGFRAGTTAKQREQMRRQGDAG